MQNRNECFYFISCVFCCCCCWWWENVAKPNRTQQKIWMNEREREWEMVKYLNCELLRVMSICWCVPINTFFSYQNRLSFKFEFFGCWTESERIHFTPYFLLVSVTLCRNRVNNLRSKFYLNKKTNFTWTVFFFVRTVLTGLYLNRTFPTWAMG